MRRAGIEPLSDRHALELFDRALADERALCMALGLNRPALRTLATAGVLPPILGGLVSVSSKRKSAAAAALAAKLAALPEAEREALPAGSGARRGRRGAGPPSGAAIDPDQAFKDMGFDSLAAVELRNRSNTVTGLQLAATTVFDYPSPQKLTARIAAQLGQSAAAETGHRSGPRRPMSRSRSSAWPAATPAGSPPPQELWELVAEGRDAIAPLPHRPRLGPGAPL